MTTLVSEMTLDIDQQIQINAPPQRVFASLLAKLGPGHETHHGKSLAMKLEPWPGGRWFRDLGDDQGHLWGHVQVIKQDALLEITGPLFMSYPVVSHLQFRVTNSGAGCTLTVRHQALGLIDPGHRQGVQEGWKYLLERVKNDADGK